MPYGLTNAPSTFQRLMEKVLDVYIGSKYLLYLDDVIVFGRSFHEDYSNLQREWDSWAHKPGLAHLSLVCTPGPSVVLCVHYQ